MHLIKICQGGSCRRNFAEESLSKAERVLEIKAGETSSDGKFRLESCGCLSNCEDGPNVFIGTIGTPLSDILGNGSVENHMVPKRIEERLNELKKIT